MIAAARWWLQREGHGDRMDIEAADGPADRSGGRAARPRARPRSSSNTFGRASADSDRQTAIPCRPPRCSACSARGRGRARAARAGGTSRELVPGFREPDDVAAPGPGPRPHRGRALHQGRRVGLARPPAYPARWPHRCTPIDDVRPLVVAALAHDIGKAIDPACHAEPGRPLARDAALRFGLTEREADDVASLVRLHLVLAETATTVDLDDEDSVLAAAALVGRPGTARAAARC